MAQNVLTLDILLRRRAQEELTKEIKLASDHLQNFFRIGYKADVTLHIPRKSVQQPDAETFTFEISPWDLFKAIEAKAWALHIEQRETDAIGSFIDSVDNFKQQLQGLETSLGER